MAQTIIGLVEIQNSGTQKTTIQLNGDTADLFAGGEGQAGNLTLRNSSRQNTIHFDGATADLFAGGGGQAGNLTLRNRAGQNTIHFDGATADLFAGGGGQAGNLTLRDSAGQQTISLNGATADLVMGGAGQAASITLNDGFGHLVLLFDGSSGRLIAKGILQSGGGGQVGGLIINDAAGNTTVNIDGAAGDILLSSADCAEEFDLSDAVASNPGTVMVLDGGDRLKPCSLAYDKRVAGVISGAGDYRPGIVLDRKLTGSQRGAVALVGKAYCKVDATYAPIEVGDLLTTSSTIGHAMKAEDPLKAFGAVIGKALAPIKQGKGLVPVLIALQ